MNIVGAATDAYSRQGNEYKEENYRDGRKVERKLGKNGD
jgi:hypothetical protein